MVRLLWNLWWDSSCSSLCYDTRPGWIALCCRWEICWESFTQGFKLVPAGVPKKTKLRTHITAEKVKDTVTFVTQVLAFNVNSKLALFERKGFIKALTLPWVCCWGLNLWALEAMLHAFTSLWDRRGACAGTPNYDDDSLSNPTCNGDLLPRVGTKQILPFYLESNILLLGGGL